MKLGGAGGWWDKRLCSSLHLHALPFFTRVFHLRTKFRPLSENGMQIAWTSGFSLTLRVAMLTQRVTWTLALKFVFVTTWHQEGHGPEEFMVSAALAQVVTTRFQSSPLLCFLLVRNTYAGVCT